MLNRWVNGWRLFIQQRKMRNFQPINKHIIFLSFSVCRLPSVLCARPCYVIPPNVRHHQQHMYTPHTRARMCTIAVWCHPRRWRRIHKRSSSYTGLGEPILLRNVQWYVRKTTLARFGDEDFDGGPKAPANETMHNLMNWMNGGTVGDNK